MFESFKPIKVSDGFIEWLKAQGFDLQPAQIPTYDGSNITQVQVMKEPVCRKFYIKDNAQLKAKEQIETSNTI